MYKWVTKTQYINVDTGEIINKNDLHKYDIIIKQTTYIINENSYRQTRNNIYECRPKAQLRLFE